LAAVPSIGRASRVEGPAPAEAELTRALYEQYAHQIFRYCLHQLGSREEAEDAVQSTFLNAFRGIKRGIVPELESAWLFKIAHNVCLSRRRSTWRRGRVESPADFEVVEELTPAPSRRADELIGLQDVLEEMPENQRRAILLREWQGLSYREIAEELELSQAAVETLIFRARRTLASGLERPPERRRIARMADLGNLATALKSLVVGGSAAAKVAATVAVVSATTVVAAEPVRHHQQAAHHSTPAPAARTAVHAARPASPPPVAVRTPAPVSAPVERKAAPAHRHARPAVKARVKAAAPAAAVPVVETPTVSEPKQTPVEPAAAPPPAEKGQAEKEQAKADKQQAKQAAKEQKRAAKEHGGPSSPPPAQETQQAPPSSSTTGTNPAGKEKDHGRWARDEQTAPATPVVTTPVETGPVGQVQPIAVPDAAAGALDK
jgi:RNA polymerase sigma factor (sigma-70 family)